MWNIFGEKPVISSAAVYPNLNYNTSFIYHVYDLNKFFKSITNNYLQFQVKVQQNHNVYCMAKGKLLIKDILNYPQNKLSYIIPLYGVQTNKNIDLGQLYVWLGLSCELEKIENFKKTNHILFLEKKNGIMIFNDKNRDAGSFTVSYNNGNNNVPEQEGMTETQILHGILEDVQKEKNFEENAAITITGKYKSSV